MSRFFSISCVPLSSHITGRNWISGAYLSMTERLASSGAHLRTIWSFMSCRAISAMISAGLSPNL